MYDVTKDVIDYFKAETRNEEEFQKIWEELAKWKAKRDEDVKNAAAAEEEKKRKERDIQLVAVKEYRQKLAVATANYMTALFKLYNKPVDYDEIVNKTFDHMLKTEEAMDFMEKLNSSLEKAKSERKEKTCKCSNDDEALARFIRNLK